MGEMYSFSAAGFFFSVWPRCRLSHFDKQIQEKHIHVKPNLSNLLTEGLKLDTRVQKNSRAAEIIFFCMRVVYILCNGCFSKS